MLAACSSNDSTGPDGANLTVRLQDTPFADARAVLVTFSEVSAHRSGEGGFTPIPILSGTTRTCDLKQLVSSTDVLGAGVLPAGHYTQIRITVTSATLYFDNTAPSPACAGGIAAPGGRSAAVTVPSGEIRLNRPFDVADGANTVITLDFDGDASIHQTGNGGYIMQPVVSVVSVTGP
jgi:hypothetical protein